MPKPLISSLRDFLITMWPVYVKKGILSVSDMAITNSLNKKI